jgi:hypothetical protein
MTAKEWFEQSGYEYQLDEHDEGGYLGIDENKVAEMLDAYHQDQMKEERPRITKGQIRDMDTLKDLLHELRCDITAIPENDENKIEIENAQETLSKAWTELLCLTRNVYTIIHE